MRFFNFLLRHSNTYIERNTALSINTIKQCCAVLVMSVLVTSCVTPSTKPSPKLVDRPNSLEQVSEFITKTSEFKEPRATDRTLSTAEFLFENEELDWARSIANKVPKDRLRGTQYIRLLSLKANIALKEGQPYLAKRFLLDTQSMTEVAIADDKVAADFLDTRATVLFNLAEFIPSIETRLHLNEALAGDELRTQLNHDLIWETLAELATEDLFILSKSERDETKQGWYSLAAISKSNGANFRRQIEDIGNWQKIWPNHPANTLLPADLQLILQLADEQAKQIALLLPLSGKLSGAGHAIKDGLMAAFYDDAANSNYAPKVIIYDTHTSDINTLYEQALGEGAELIIGPLSKHNVSALAERLSLPIPVLALNTTQTKPVSHTQASDTQTPENIEPTIGISLPHENLFQFSLAIEGEARQVAEKAWVDGHRNALIISPMSTWGDRGTTAFTQRWHELGGNIIRDSRFKDQRSYSALIEASLSVDQSKQRKRALQRILGASLEFEPRRRKDIDFVFLLAYSSQAQQLKPLLAFHYAGDIPVYATSQIYDGDAGQIINDLNGVRFTTLPWNFDEQLPERRAIQAYGDAPTNYNALYALGVDSYHIFPRLKQLQNIRQANFYGSTGKLKLSENNLFIRQQAWAEIISGRAIEIKNTSASEIEL